MKFLITLILGLTFAGTAAAQAAENSSSTDASPVTVTKIKWRQEVFIPALYDDPMQINQDQKELERDRRATAKENSDRVQRGQAPLPPPNKKIAANVPVGETPMGVDDTVGNRNLPAKEAPGLSSVHYIYEARVKNSGDKTVSAILWVYSLFDNTGAEVGTHRFRDFVNIRPGKEANLVRRSKVPPTTIVHAKKSGQDINEKYSERVVIARIDYSDGTFWERPLPRN
jgi:hypothetical protein